ATAGPATRSSGPAPSPGTGSTTTTASWSPRRAGSTSTAGSGRPRCSAPRGATRTRRRWSWPPRRPWSGGCRGAASTASPRSRARAPALVAAAETARERRLEVAIIDGKPSFRRLEAAETLVEQGDTGTDVYLLFDGVLMVEIDGKPVTELGPGAVVGEMALLEGGRRTATLRAVTPCRIAVVAGEQLDRDALAEVARARRQPDGWHGRGRTPAGDAAGRRLDLPPGPAPAGLVAAAGPAPLRRRPR